jgi:uncharacterized protein YkwD
MMILLRLFIAMLFAGQMLAAAQQPSNASRDSSAAQEQGAVAYVEDAESQLTRLLNQERTQRGLQPLALDQRLSDAAREHSVLMADKHVLSHGFPDEPALPERLAGTGIRFDRSGENVAFGKTVEEVEEGLMKSPPHRANILNSEFSAVGIGIVRHDGLLWVTENFARRLEFRTERQVEELLAQEFQQARRKSGRKPARLEQVRGLEQAACSMAQEGKLDATRARSLFGPHAGAAAFSGAELSELPSEWLKVAQMPALTRYAVGVCFRRSERFPSGGYWAVLVFE